MFVNYLQLIVGYSVLRLMSRKYVWFVVTQILVNFASGQATPYPILTYSYLYRLKLTNFNEVL